MLKIFRENRDIALSEERTAQSEINKKFAPKQISFELENTELSLQDCVKLGQYIGKDLSGKNIFSGVSGTVSELSQKSGSRIFVSIKNDFKNTLSECVLPFGQRKAVKVTDLTVNELVCEIESKGISTYGRQISQKKRTLSERISESAGKARQIVINGICTEPYDTSALRMVLEYGDDLVKGMKILMAVMKIGEGVVVLDPGREKEASELSQKLSDGDNIKVILTDVRYPADNEHMLLHALTSLELSLAKNAERIKCVVFDIREVISVGRAFVYGEPETASICTTLAGSGAEKEMNVAIPYGTNISEIADFCGVDTESTDIIAHGLLRGEKMCGNERFDSSMSHLVFLKKEDAVDFSGEKCIRCAKCVEVCPMLLLPSYIAMSGGNKKIGKCFDMNSCIECGACQYVCPENIPILEYIKKIKYQAQGGDVK